jgi:hypothetical protein
MLPALLLKFDTRDYSTASDLDKTGNNPITKKLAVEEI